MHFFLCYTNRTKWTHLENIFWDPKNVCKNKKKDLENTIPPKTESSLGGGGRRRSDAICTSVQKILSLFPPTFSKRLDRLFPEVLELKRGCFRYSPGPHWSRPGAAARLADAPESPVALLVNYPRRGRVMGENSLPLPPPPAEIVCCCCRVWCESARSPEGVFRREKDGGMGVGMEGRKGLFEARKPFVPIEKPSRPSTPCGHVCMNEILWEILTRAWERRRHSIETEIRWGVSDFLGHEK